MSKDTFLKELRGCLQILEDQEQQDIIEEYTQHIDMKIQKGLSEEEAIRDFGPVKELAAGILEAYHVKPDFGEKKPRMKLPDLSGIKAADGEKAMENVKKTGNAVGGFFRKGFRWVSDKIKAAGQWLTKLFCKRKAPDGMEGEKEAMEMGDAGNRNTACGNTAYGRSGKSGVLSAVGRGMARLWKGFLALCRWCLRLAWNVFWIFVSAMSGVFAVLALFGFGALVVLLAQGYPFAGIALMTFGFLLCSTAVTAAAFGFVRRKDTEEREAAWEEENEPEADIAEEAEQEEMRYE